MKVLAMHVCVRMCVFDMYVCVLFSVSVSGS